MAPLTSTQAAPQTIRQPTAATAGTRQPPPIAEGAPTRPAPAPAAPASLVPVVPIAGGLTPDTIPWMALAHSLLYTLTPTPPTRMPNTPPLLVILDLNGVLLERWSPFIGEKGGVNAASYRAPDARLRKGIKLWVRPGARRFVAAMTRRHAVGVWSSATQLNVTAMIGVVWTPEDAKQLVFVRSRKQCREDTQGGGEFGTEKVLADLRDPRFGVTNTVMVDDTPSKVRQQPANAVILPGYSAAAAASGRVNFYNDDTLDWLALYLEYVALGRGAFGGGGPPTAEEGNKPGGPASDTSDVRGCLAVLPFDAFVAAGRKVAMDLSGNPAARAIYGYPYVSPVFVWTQVGDMVYRLRTSARGWTPPAEPLEEGTIGTPGSQGKEEPVEKDAYVPQ
ncbi:hypothetical protein MMPV_000119 [Pyropia vietnamensis]